MASVVSAIRDTVSISLFNKGQAGKIFAEVREKGAKVVMKNNTPEVVILSPEEYLKLMDEVNEARLLAIANKRMAHYDPSKNITQEEIYKKYEIAAEDVSHYGEVEFE